MTAPTSGPSPLRLAQEGERLKSYGAAGGQQVGLFSDNLQPRRIKMTKLDHTGTPASAESARFTWYLN